jgi:RNA-directed DNA polymerase
MWLEAPVVERSEGQGGGSKWSRPKKGTPQGGVASPLLANLYLHWFDKVFHQSTGPAHWAKAKLVRYADDFVVLARYQPERLRRYIEEKLETWMMLEINREKTRVVDLRKKGASLDFLGYTFRYDRDLYGRDRRYLNVFPSKKAMVRERDRIGEALSRRMSYQPVPHRIQALNRHLRGWANYFSFGYPRKQLRQINWFVRFRLVRHLRRHRSQRPFRIPAGASAYAYFERLGLILL